MTEGSSGVRSRKKALDCFDSQSPNLNDTCKEIEQENPMMIIAITPQHHPYYQIRVTRTRASL
jgi:hypothetical protein